jgi:hypothetical protein
MGALFFLMRTRKGRKRPLAHISNTGLRPDADKGDFVRQASEDLIRRFDMLDKQITDRIKSGKRHL